MRIEILTSLTRVSHLTEKGRPIRTPKLLILPTRFYPIGINDHDLLPYLT